ncbi:MAG: flagellar basal body-associated FliL family protein [Pseudomonadota bacterium]
MSDSAQSPGDEAATGSSPIRALMLAAPVALLLGGGAFAVMFLDVLGLQGGESAAAVSPYAVPDTAPPVFLEIEQITLTVGAAHQPRMLRFSATLEVEEDEKSALEDVAPRIRDVLYTYLMALDPKVLESPAALVKMRAQMLRRVQLVAGPARVRDLLITEFLLS